MFNAKVYTVSISSSDVALLVGKIFLRIMKYEPFN